MLPQTFQLTEAPLLCLAHISYLSHEHLTVPSSRIKPENPEGSGRVLQVSVTPDLRSDHETPIPTV